MVLRLVLSACHQWLAWITAMLVGSSRCLPLPVLVLGIDPMHNRQALALTWVVGRCRTPSVVRSLTPRQAHPLHNRLRLTELRSSAMILRLCLAA